MDGSSEQTGERIRLAFGPFFWRSFALLAFTGELALWTAIRRQAGGFPPGLRLAWLIGYTPRTLFLAFVLALVLTLAVDLFVRALVDAPLRRWLSPRTDREDDAGRGFGFHLDATERVVEEIPARRRGRRQSEPGTLVLTDRRLWFFPSAWDGEPWSVPRDQVHSATLEPVSGISGRLIRGLPPFVRIQTSLDPNIPATFSLAEPHRVRSWFDAQSASPFRSVSSATI